MPKELNYGKIELSLIKNRIDRYKLKMRLLNKFKTPEELEKYIRNKVKK